MKTKLLYLFLFAFSLSYAQIPTNGLSAEYNFTTGSLNDGVGTNNFTQTGSSLTTITDRIGNANNAISLNGDYLQRNPVFSGDLSVSFWIKSSGSGGDKLTIIDQSRRVGDAENALTGWYLYLQNGKVGVAGNFGISATISASFGGGSEGGQSGYFNTQGTTNLSDGAWHHITVTMQKDIFRASNGSFFRFKYFYRVYVDGVLENTGESIKGTSQGPPGYFSFSGNAYLLSNSTNVTVANNNDTDLTHRFSEQIDDILFYNRMLSTAEVQQIGSYCLGGVPLSSVLSVPSVLENSATVDVSISNIYDIAYHKSTEPFSNAVIVPNISTSSTTISSLDASSNYKIYVREQCSPISVTGWSDFITFQTTTPIVILYVDENATGNNDGSSWTDAYMNLQDALNNASSFNNIWVAKGTYKPHASDRDASFIVNNNLYGGFAGTEVSFSDRDISLIHTINATLLDGDLLSDDDTTVDFNDSTRDDNSKHVVEVAANNLEINGFTIQNGYADALNGDDRFGAGIFKESTVPNLTIKNCKIKNNIALAGAGLSLVVTSDSNITIDACTIEGNLANVAAGLDYHLSGSSAQMNIVITNCLFNNNKTDDDTAKSRLGSGAAAARLRAYFGGVELHATIVNNTFAFNNSLGATGGSATGNFPVIAITRNTGAFGNITVANNIFWGNLRVNGQTAPAIGKASNSSSPFNSIIISSGIVRNNTEEDGFSTFTSTPPNTITVDPLFTNSIDFTLQTSSTAINSGDNSYVIVNNDLLNNQRIFNTTVDRGAYEFGSSTLGIEDNELLENFKLYPNPVRNTLNIQLEESLEKVEIYSIQGQKVFEKTTSTINVSNLSSGMYLLKVYTETGKIGIKRFIKQ